MLRYVMLLVAGLVLVALLSRNPGTRRLLWALAGLAALYIILKLTGVIEAIAPGRPGVS